jgi:hypothetical protein
VNSVAGITYIYMYIVFSIPLSSMVTWVLCDCALLVLMFAYIFFLFGEIGIFGIFDPVA